MQQHHRLARSADGSHFAIDLLRGQHAAARHPAADDDGGQRQIATAAGHAVGEGADLLQRQHRAAQQRRCAGHVHGWGEVGGVGGRDDAVDVDRVRQGRRALRRQSARQGHRQLGGNRTGLRDRVHACSALVLSWLVVAARGLVLAGVRRVEDGEALKAHASARLQPIILDVTETIS